MLNGNLLTPAGFRAAGVACGIKAEGLDLAVVVADRLASAAAVYTTNRLQAAPIAVCREHLADGQARAFVVNSGCANAATGAAGVADAREMTRLVARGLGCRAEEVAVASTGVIGVPLPMERLSTGIETAVGGLAREGGEDAARAIMTTDTRPKQTAVEFQWDGRRAWIGAMAKGSGMIAPDMATMLAFFTTDAAVAPELLRRALAEAVGESFNRISVDGDTSKNDMALILAGGRDSTSEITTDGADFDAFRAALIEASRRMAGEIIRDGEGATRMAEVRVDGASSARDADRIARGVAESLLVKTALFGRDPNWGRVLGAVGAAGVDVDMERVELFFGDIRVAAAGCAAEYDESAARAALDEDPGRIRVRMHDGEASGWIWTCDLSHGYVDINASYRS